MGGLNKEQRAKRALDDLRPVLKEILAVGMAEKYVDVKIDAARGLEGLNHAEEALREFESGEWSATEPNDPEIGSEREDYESDVDLEDALAKLRESATRNCVRPHLTKCSRRLTQRPAAGTLAQVRPSRRRSVQS